MLFSNGKIFAGIYCVIYKWQVETTLQKNQRVKTVYLLCNNFVEVIFASFQLLGF